MGLLGLIYYVILGIWQSACAYFGVKLATPRASLAENGTVSYVIVVSIVLFQSIIWSSSHNMWCVIFYVVNILLVPLVIGTYIYLFNWELMIVLRRAIFHIDVWLSAVLSVLFALLPSVLFNTLRYRFAPTKVRLYAEQYNQKPVQPLLAK